MADDFIPYKAEDSTPDFIPYSAPPSDSAPPPQQASGSVSKSPHPTDNPFAMIGEGEEVDAQGRAAMAPSVVPGAVAEGAGMLGGPGAAGAAYAGTKYLMAPEEVKAHPYRTAAETAAIVAGPAILKKAGDYLAPTFQKLSQNAGRVYDYLTTPFIKTADEAAPAAASSPARVPLQLPEHASGAQVGPSSLPGGRASMREQLGGKIPQEPPARVPPAAAPAPVAGPQIGKVTHVPPAPAPGPPLTNKQIAAKIASTVKQAAGTTEQTPIYTRTPQTVGKPVVVPPARVPTPSTLSSSTAAAPEVPAPVAGARGTVGAQTVGEQPSIEIPGPRIQTPSRNETLTEAMKNRVPGSNPLERKIPLEEQPISPARTPQQPAEETVHPMDRQFIHVNGGRLLEQIADKPELRDPLLDLEGGQLREVLRKSGEDMSQIQTVGKSGGKAVRGGKIADPTNITRQEAFDRLLDRGYTPEQILKEAPPRSKPAAVRVPFGPPRPARGL